MSLLVRFVPILASFFVFASAQCAFDSLSAYSPELGKCYYRNIRTALDWMSAEQLCVDNNWGHLATVDNAFASNIVFKLLSAANVTNAWIGAHRNPNGNNYVWVDGSAWNYMNWANGYPIVTNSIRDCVEFNSDQTNVQMAQKWRNVDCNQHKEFVCEVILSQG